MTEKSDYTFVHRKMMRYVFLQTELLLNDGISELSEYDIQSMIFTFFRARQEKYNLYEATRETNNKTDIVVLQSTGDKIFIELKTYFKKHEKFKKSHFEGDFKKLVKDIINPNSRAFFVIAGALNKFNDKEVANFDFLNGKKLKKKSWTNYEINDNGKKVHIKIRPSHAESQRKSRLWSWEIMGKSIVSQ